jgi:hypothetical protein
MRAGARLEARSCAVACLLSVTLVTARGHAQTCPIPDGASSRLASVPARERLEFIRATMDEQARYTSIWKWAWVGIGSATVVVSTAVTIGFAFGSDPARNANIIDNTAAAVFSVATPIVTIAFAPRVERDAPVLRALIRDTGGGTAGTCLVLARAEELLSRGAEDEDLATGWLAHVVSILGAGVLFGFMAVEAALATDAPSRDAHWQNAVINGLAGVAYAEAQILTTPTGASRGYARYLAGDLHRKSSPSVSVRPMGAGLSLEVSF